MSVAYYEKSATNATGTGTSYTPALPAAPADGWKSTDAFVAVVFERGGATTHGCATSGWSRYGAGDLTLGSNLRVSIWWARGTAVSNPTVTKGSSQGVGYVLAFRNVIGSGSPFDSGSATALTDNTSSANGSTAAITTTGDGRAILHVIGHGHATNSAETYTVSGASICTNNPSWSTASQASGTSTTRISSTVAIGLQQVAGSTGAQAYTESVTPTTTYHTGSLLLALVPAADSSPGAQLGFADDFSANDIANWTVNGSWSISSGALRNSDADGAWKRAAPTGVLFRNGFVQSTVRWTGTTDRTSRVECRVVDANNWIAAQVAPAGSSIALYEYTGASLHGPLGSYGAAFNADTDYVVRIEFDGPAITVKVDGVARITCRSTSMYDGAPDVACAGTSGETQFRAFSAGSPSGRSVGHSTLTAAPSTEGTERSVGHSVLAIVSDVRAVGHSKLITGGSGRALGHSALAGPPTSKSRAAGTARLAVPVTKTLTARGRAAAWDVSGSSSPASITVWPTRNPLLVSPAQGDVVGTTFTLRGVNAVPNASVRLRVNGAVVDTLTSDGAGEFSTLLTLAAGAAQIVAETDANVAGGGVSPTLGVSVGGEVLPVTVEGVTLARAIGVKSSVSAGLTNCAGITWNSGAFGSGYSTVWVPTPQNATEALTVWNLRKGMKGSQAGIYCADVAVCPWAAYALPEMISASDVFDTTYASNPANWYFGTGLAGSSPETQSRHSWLMLKQLLGFRPDLWASEVSLVTDFLESLPRDPSTGAVIISHNAQTAGPFGSAGKYSDSGYLDSLDMTYGATAPWRSFGGTVGVAWTYKQLRDYAMSVGDTDRAAAFDANLQSFVTAIGTFKHKVNGASWDPNYYGAGNGQWVGGEWDGFYYTTSNPYTSTDAQVTPYHRQRFSGYAVVWLAQLPLPKEDLDQIASAVAALFASYRHGFTFYRGQTRNLVYPEYFRPEGDALTKKGNFSNGGFWGGEQTSGAAIFMARANLDLAAEFLQEATDEAMRERRVGGALWEYLIDPMIKPGDVTQGHGSEGIGLSFVPLAAEGMADWIDFTIQGGTCTAAVDSLGRTLTVASGRVDMPHGHMVTGYTLSTDNGRSASGSATLYGRQYVNSDGEAFPSPKNYGSETSMGSLALVSASTVSSAAGAVKPAAVYGGDLRAAMTGGDGGGYVLRALMPKTLSVSWVTADAGTSQPVPPGFLLKAYDASGNSPAAAICGDDLATSIAAFASYPTVKLTDAQGNVIATGSQGQWPRY